MDEMVCQIFLFSFSPQHFHQINQEKRTVVLHSIGGLTDSFNGLD